MSQDHRDDVKNPGENAPTNTERSTEMTSLASFGAPLFPWLASRTRAAA